MRIIWRILRYLSAYRGRLIVAYVCLFAAIAAQLTVPRLVQYVIDDGIVDGQSSVILTGSLLIVGAVAIQSVFTYIRSYLFQALAEHVSTDISCPDCAVSKN